VAAELGSPSSWQARLRPWLARWSAPLRVGLGAVAVWVITVAPVAAASRAGVAERVLSALALMAGLAAPAIAARNPRWARHLGLSAFPALALAAWISSSLGPGLPRFDGYRAVLGALGWGLFALGWWHPWSRPEAEMRRVDIRPASPLEPRRRLPRSTVVIGALGACSALSCLALGWRVTDPERAVLGQTLAVAAAIGLLGAGASLALIAGRLPEHQPAAGRGRPVGLPRAFFRSLIALLALVLAAVALALTRS
jgi:hypothetical protein